MQFKSYEGGAAAASQAGGQVGTNESEQLFKTVKGEDMNITMTEANITTTGYVSDEVKEQQVFYHYNNTNLFISFREKYIKK